MSYSYRLLAILEFLSIFWFLEIEFKGGVLACRFLTANIFLFSIDLGTFPSYLTKCFLFIIFVLLNPTVLTNYFVEGLLGVFTKGI